MLCVSKRSVSGRFFFNCPKTHVLSTVIKIVHKKALFSEYSVSKIYFALSGISKIGSSNYQDLAINDICVHKRSTALKRSVNTFTGWLKHF